jgi:hypothetical protein
MAGCASYINLFMLIERKIAAKNGKALSSKNSLEISTNQKRKTENAVKY